MRRMFANSSLPTDWGKQMTSYLKTAENDETGGAGKRQEIHLFPIVLVVEGYPAVRHFVEIALREFDLDVRLASNGNEAVQTYRRGGIDLVLMDVGMPVMDGPETLARLKAIHPEVVCCIMSAYTGKYNQDEMMRLGAAWASPKAVPPGRTSTNGHGCGRES